MILTDKIKNIIERKLGADIDLMGAKSIESAVLSEMKKSKADSIGEFEKLLRIDNDIYNSFIDEIIVPKTWFFRNKDSFLFLKEEVSKELKSNKDYFIKILSIPCSTGEEPYSIAATLFEAGLKKNQFHIDAMDISNKSISIAKNGVYLKKQSYFEEVDYSEKYIFEKDGSIMVDDILKDQITFFNANLLDVFGINNTKYDVIFCRNVFIYLNQKSRNAVITNLKNKLAKNGMLFTGHAEINIFFNCGFIKVDSKNSFVCKIEKRENKKTIIKKIKKVKVDRRKVDFTRVFKEKTKLVETLIEKKDGKFFSLQEIKSFADNGDYKQAMDLCESYLDMKNPNAEIYCIKGLIHQLQNDLDMAQKCFEKAIYLKPYYYDALLHMSILYEKKGSLDQSERFKKRAQKSFSLIGKFENDFLEKKINE